MKLAKLALLRRPALIVAVLVLVAGVVAGREKPTLELARESSRPAQVVDDGIDLALLERPQAAAPQADLFARRSFAPAPVRHGAAAPQAPSAPPLPFRYIGKLIEDGKLEVILLRGAEHLTVTGAGKLDAEYRVESVTQTRVAFTYLPLNIAQSLDIQ